MSGSFAAIRLAEKCQLVAEQNANRLLKLCRKMDALSTERDNLQRICEINAETVREQQREISRLQGLLAAAGIEYEEKQS